VKLLEYEAKEILARRQIPVPEGVAARTEDEIAAACARLGGKAVLKAQVPAGGRGKAGGVLFPRDVEEAREMGRKLLGMAIQGEPVEAVLVEKALDIDREYYLAVTTDRKQGCPLLMFSSKGGMEIEDLVGKHPGAVKKRRIRPFVGLQAYQLRSMLKDAEGPPDVHDAIFEIATALYDAYWDLDGELIELNPLAVTATGELFAVDAKFSVDDYALYRQPELPARPVKTVAERAAAAGMTFISLDGDIGVISNGAGLSMITMDYLQMYGARPANFLDGKVALLMGGFETALGLVLEDPGVKAVLVNIFTAAGDCERIAGNIVETVTDKEEHGTLAVPLVVTLGGSNRDRGLDILSQFDSPLLLHEREVEDAARRIVGIAAE